MAITDPVEAVVACALISANVRFVHEATDNDATRGLDFWLPEPDVFIECKQFHTRRIAEQLARAENVIVIQGMRAARAFAQLLQPEVTLKPVWTGTIFASAKMERATPVLQESSGASAVAGRCRIARKAGAGAARHLPASAIEAPSGGETRSGSTEGESAARFAGDAQ